MSHIAALFRGSSARRLPTKSRRASRPQRFESLEARTLMACTVVDANWTNAGGGCKDATTQLVWSVQSGTAAGQNFSQSGAKAYANNLVEGGFSDWRLPTQAELEEAADHGIYNHDGIINATNWTSTPGTTANSFWGVYLNADVSRSLSKGSILGVVAVRGTRQVTNSSVPGVRVYSQQLDIGEPSGGRPFTVVLDKPPTANVMILVTSTDPTEAVATVSSLTFTPQNWNVAQWGRVNAIDDALSDGLQTVTIALGNAVSADPAYQGLTVDDITVNVADDEPVAVVSKQGNDHDAIDGAWQKTAFDPRAGAAIDHVFSLFESMQRRTRRRSPSV